MSNKNTHIADFESCVFRMQIQPKGHWTIASRAFASHGFLPPEVLPPSTFAS